MDGFPPQEVSWAPVAEDPLGHDQHHWIRPTAKPFREYGRVVCRREPRVYRVPRTAFRQLVGTTVVAPTHSAKPLA